MDYLAPTSHAPCADKLLYLHEYHVLFEVSRYSPSIILMTTESNFSTPANSSIVHAILTGMMRQHIEHK